MTDTEISSALAKAIGWPEEWVLQRGDEVLVGWKPVAGTGKKQRYFRQFDYRDPYVWAKLVEGYGITVYGPSAGIDFCTAVIAGAALTGKTYAKAIALLVIELAKRGKLPERKV